MAIIFRILSIVILISAFTYCNEASADPELIRNRDPLKAPQTVRLEELWRVGGEDGDLIFGAIVEAIADPDGNVYLFDHHMKQVEVISPGGEHLRTLSREGEGPGEVRRPRDMVYLPDGRIGLAELAPSKLVTVTKTGEPAGTIALGGDGGVDNGFTVTLSCEHRNHTFLLGGQTSTPIDIGMDRTQYLSLLSETGLETKRLREASAVLNFAAALLVEKDLVPPFIFVNTIGPDGRVYVPRDRHSYAIEVYSPEGVLEKIIERKYVNRKRTDRELRRLNTLFSSMARDTGLEIKMDIESDNQVIAGMFVDSQNRLWIKHAKSGDDLPAGILLSFDIFDADGRYLQEVQIASEGDAAYDDLEFLPDGRVLLIKGYVLAQWETFDSSAINWDEGVDSGPMEIICCEMKW